MFHETSGGGSESQIYKGLPVVLFESAGEWEAWLERNHADSAGLWARIAKKGAAYASAGYAELLDAALCYGWIDGQKARWDEASFLQRFTPRKKRSIWSKTNREKIAALEKAGRMKPAGRRAVELAKQNGQWEAAYDSVASAGVPDDLARRLAADREARDFFATLSSQNRYAILHRLQTARRPETRAARLEKFMAMLSARETIYPQ